jgi:hypothetical protein
MQKSTNRSTLPCWAHKPSGLPVPPIGVRVISCVMTRAIPGGCDDYACGTGTGQISASIAGDHVHASVPKLPCARVDTQGPHYYSIWWLGVTSLAWFV